MKVLKILNLLCETGYEEVQHCPNTLHIMLYISLARILAKI